jgi:hypothetical protein
MHAVVDAVAAVKPEVSGSSAFEKRSFSARKTAVEI